MKKSLLVATAVDMTLTMGLSPLMGYTEKQTAAVLKKYKIKLIMDLKPADKDKLAKELAATLNKKTEKQLVEAITKEADPKGEDGIRATDKFTVETWAVLAELNLLPEGKTVEPKEEKVPPKNPKTEKAPAPAEPAPPSAKKKTTKKGPTAADLTKPEKKKRQQRSLVYTRTKAFADALKAGLNKTDKLLVRADALYVKNGGRSDPNAAAKTQRRALALLKVFGMVTVTGKHVEVNFKL